jgi:hypothetical protein
MKKTKEFKMSSWESLLIENMNNEENKLPQKKYKSI